MDCCDATGQMTAFNSRNSQGHSPGFVLKVTDCSQDASSDVRSADWHDSTKAVNFSR